jgi:putative transcriptional regulator
VPVRDDSDHLRRYGLAFAGCGGRLFQQISSNCRIHNHLAGGLFLPSRPFHFQPPLQMKNKLRELRAAKEWSQSDLADKLEVSRQTINAIETEKYDSSLPLAFKVAKLFKKPIEEIFED